jgi:hypothetical protein
MMKTTETKKERSNNKTLFKVGDAVCRRTLEDIDYCASEIERWENAKKLIAEKTFNEIGLILEVIELEPRLQRHHRVFYTIRFPGRIEYLPERDIKSIY